MAKKKRDEETIEITNSDGSTTVVPRGDLDDKQWAALSEQFMKPSTAADQGELDNRVNNTPEYRKKQQAAVDEGNAATVAKAAKQGVEDHTGEDFMVVKGANGQKVTVMRGPLDDAAWNSSVETAKKNGRLINSVETLPPAPVEAPKAGEGTGTKAGIVKSMASKLAEGSYQEGAATGKKMVDAANLDTPDQPDSGAVAKGKSAAQAIGNIDDLSGGTTLSDAVAGKVAPTPKPAPAGKPDFTIGDAGIARPQLDKQETDPELARLQNEKTDLMDAGLPQPMPAQPGIMDRVGGALKKGADFLGLLPGGQQVPLDGGVTPPAANPGALPPIPPGQSAFDQTQNSVAPRNMLAGGVEGALSRGPVPPDPTGGKGKPQFVPAVGGMQIPSMPDRQAEIDKAYAQADDARAKNAELQSQGLKDQARIQQEGMDAQVRMQADIMSQQERMQKVQADGAAAYQKTLAEMQAPSHVDPDHWWNSRSTAQQIFAVLSAGLTKGATLGMFQHAIDRDVAAQEADISNKRQALGAKAAGQLNGMQIARQNGLDLYEAQKANKAYAWDQVDRQAKQAALNTSSEVVKANALEMSSIAQQQKIKEETSMDQHRQLMALEGEKLKMEDRHNRSMEGAAWTRANKAGGEKPGQPLRGPQAQGIIDLTNALESAQGYSKEFKTKANGFFAKIAAWDPTGHTEASKYNAKRDVAIQLIGKALEGGVLKEDDIVRYERMIPKAGDLQGATRWDELTKQLKQRLSGKTGAIQGFKSANFNTGSMDSFSGAGGLSDEDTASALGFEGE